MFNWVIDFQIYFENYESGLSRTCLWWNIGLVARLQIDSKSEGSIFASQQCLDDLL